MILEGAEIRRRLEEEGAPLSAGESVQDLLSRFAGEVRRWGGRMHLVGKSNIEENIMISLLDSLHLLRFAERSGEIAGKNGGRSAVADIGSGAGFPGIVWSIARPDMDITLFERREKPRLFLERTVALLGLEGIASVRGEARDGRGEARFDLVVSKAAGRLEAIVPLAMELLAPGGIYLTIKGEGWRGELPGTAEGPMGFEKAEELPGGRGKMLRFRRTGG